MKLWTIFRFEFVYQLKRISTWLCMAVLLGFTFLMNLLTTPGDGVYPNNTFHITAITVIGAFIWLVIAAAITGEAAARDVQTRMHPLVYTSPVTKLYYLGGRFLAAFSINALLLLALPLGVLLSFYLPGLAQEELLPFRPWAYANVYFLIALPVAFVATALQFSFATLSRQVMTSYLASILLAFFAQVMAITIARLSGNWDLVKLLDPVGVTGIVGNELQTWSPLEKNTRLVELEGMFLWNRVLWLTIAAGVLWVTYHRFSFTHLIGNSWRSRFKRQSNVPAQPETAIVKPAILQVPLVERRFSFAAYFYQTLTIAWHSFTTIARHPLGLTLVAAVTIVSIVFSDKILVQFGIPLLPTTPQVVNYLAVPVGNLGSPWVVIPLLIVYFSGQLVWRERDAGISEIADATPIPDWALFTGKFLGLALIIFTWLALLLAAGIGMQLRMNHSNFETGLYLQTLFGIQLIEYLLFALLALVVHSVVNHKYVGYLVLLLVFGFMAFPASFGMEHPLLIFSADAGWWYTDMRGFGNTLGAWLWFNLYWVAWAFLLAVVARLLWVRGREQTLIQRVQAAKRGFTRSTALVAIVGAGAVVTLGSFIFYNTNVLNAYSTNLDMQALNADYERLYSQYRNTPQPQLSATKLHIEIYPEQQQVEIRAKYTLVNEHNLPIDSIHFGSVSGIHPIAITFNRPSKAVLTDNKLSYYIYTLDKPLQPGDSVQLSFVVNYKQRGFSHTSSNALVVENGTNFTNFDLLPTIGYQHYRELKDDVLRKKHKLPARPELPSLYDEEARKKAFTSDQTTFEAVIGTTKNEIAVAPGSLQRSWSKVDRRYFHYKTDASIGGEYTVLSANYKMQETKWNDVAIKIYYHPVHNQNIDRMLRSAEASLAYYSEQFGPYPYKQLTLVERAGNTSGATADAGIIYYGEQYALLNPDDSPDGFDLPYYILAHEVAHQWWGMARLTPAHVEGAGVLLEGLAVYAGMQVLQKHYGQGHLQQYVDYLHDAYAAPRTLATAPLLQANEAFLYYRKGGLAMHALSKYIGQEKVNRALRALLQKRSSGEIALPTTLNLYQELQHVTPDSLTYLLHDLFKENAYYRLKTKQLVAEQTITGNWLVTLEVHAQKVIVDATGAEKEVPMQDWLEVGLYEEGNGLGKPLYLQMHRIRAGEQTIKITVPRKPALGGIDPNKLMIDLRPDDNMMQVGE